MSLEINDTEDSRRAFLNLMEQITAVNGLLNNAVALNAIVTKELSKAENKRIIAQNQEAERLTEEHNRLSGLESTLREQTALVDVEIAEKKVEFDKMDMIHKESMKSLRSTARELVREIETRLEGLDRDLTSRVWCYSEEQNRVLP